MPRLSQSKARPYSGCNIRRADVANILESTLGTTRYSLFPNYAHRGYLLAPGRLLRSRTSRKHENRVIPASRKDPSTAAPSGAVSRKMNSKDVRSFVGKLWVLL